MVQPNYHKTSWPPEMEVVASTSLEGVAAIEVLDAEELLGIGLGTDILVVDDDATNLTAYEAALAPLGRRLVLAQSGVLALGRLLEQDFALILLDVSMPEMSGLETARRIRQRARNRGLPIIFITGLASSADVILEAYEVGAHDFIVKPILPEVLRAKARVYLQLQERTLALRGYSEKLREVRQLLGEVSEKLRERDVAAAAASKLQLAMLSHELRNPLWTMVNALELLRRRGGTVEPEIAVLARQVEHLTHIVGDLLDVERTMLGKVMLRREAVKLARVVAEAIDDMRPVIGRQAHQVTVNVPEDLLVDADRHRIHQVLDNLIANAVAYTSEGGRIEVSAVEEGAFVRIAVRDNGRGIPRSLLPHIFELFVQGEQTLDRNEGGLGVGLTLVRTLVELHGGMVEAHSDGPGSGATFAVRWPVASETTATAQILPIARPVPATGRRILVVDDNSDAADLLATLLQSLGHQVALAFDGATALDVARDFAPHVALLDVGLPVMDGYELAQRLRQLEICRGTRLIAITGYGQPGDRKRSKDAGFEHHLVKPVDLATLLPLLGAVPGDDPVSR